MSFVDAYAPMTDPKTAALGRLLSALAEDAIFGLSTGGGLPMLEGLGRRRADAYHAIVGGHRLATMSNELDHWLVEMTRASAPVYPPEWLPMGEVLREKVTLELGARGLRSLFSSKPTEKDVLRVKRMGTLAARVLRAVLAADGPLDLEEQRTVASFIAALGLPDEHAQPLYVEPPIQAEQLDVYGDLEPSCSKALLRGAWLAAASDTVDPREEHVIRVVANKLNVPAMDLEVLRNEVATKIETRRIVGQAAVDAIRFVLSDRMPGHGVTLAAKTGWMLLPRRYRDEVLAPLGHGARVTLSRRFIQLSSDEKNTVLAIAWAAALYEDPSVARRALLRSRHERVALDLGEDGAKSRFGVDEWVSEVLAVAASPMGAE
jgi:hypothetical protein